jgi:hypothetical protein
MALERYPGPRLRADILDDATRLDRGLDIARSGRASWSSDHARCRGQDGRDIRRTRADRHKFRAIHEVLRRRVLVNDRPFPSRACQDEKGALLPLSEE